MRQQTQRSKGPLDEDRTGNTIRDRLPDLRIHAEPTRGRGDQPGRWPRVLGCVRFNDPEELDEVLGWMHDNTDGKPFGVDIVMPAKIPTEAATPTSTR